MGYNAKAGKPFGAYQNLPMSYSDVTPPSTAGNTEWLWEGPRPAKTHKAWAAGRLETKQLTWVVGQHFPGPKQFLGKPRPGDAPRTGQASCSGPAQVARHHGSVLRL